MRSCMTNTTCGPKLAQLGAKRVYPIVSNNTPARTAPGSCLIDTAADSKHKYTTRAPDTSNKIRARSHATRGSHTVLLFIEVAIDGLKVQAHIVRALHGCKPSTAQLTKDAHMDFIVEAPGILG